MNFDSGSLLCSHYYSQNIGHIFITPKHFLFLTPASGPMACYVFITSSRSKKANLPEALTFSRKHALLSLVFANGHGCLQDSGCSRWDLVWSFICGFSRHSLRCEAAGASGMTWYKKPYCCCLGSHRSPNLVGRGHTNKKLNEDMWNELSGQGRKSRNVRRSCHTVVLAGWAVGTVSERHSGKRGQSVLGWSGKGSKKKRGIVNTACYSPSPSTPSPLCVTASLKPLIPRIGKKFHFPSSHPTASPCLLLLFLFASVLNFLSRLFFAGL